MDRLITFNALLVTLLLFTDFSSSSQDLDDQSPVRDLPKASGGHQASSHHGNFTRLLGETSSEEDFGFSSMNNWWKRQQCSLGYCKHSRRL
jgi:hypothetical protein